MSQSVHARLLRPVEVLHGNPLPIAIIEINIRCGECLMRCAGSIVLTGLSVLAASASAQTYYLTVEDGRYKPCYSAGQCSGGALTADTRDQVEVAIGTPSDTTPVTDRRVYRKSRVAIDGGRVTLYHRVQVAGFPHWRITRDTRLRDRRSLAYAAVQLADTLTITGATGKGYFLPVYRVHGRISRPRSAYLDAFLFIDARISGSRSERRGWTSDARLWSQSHDIAELYRFERSSAMEFEFGVPFLYHVTYFSRVVPDGPYDKTATIVDFSAHDDLTVDFLRVELRGILITNGDGEPVSRARISSHSGIEYPVQILPRGKQKRR